MRGVLVGGFGLRECFGEAGDVLEVKRGMYAHKNTLHQPHLTALERMIRAAEFSEGLFEDKNPKLITVRGGEARLA